MYNKRTVQYQETNILTASQGRLIVMLYDGCLKNLEVALREFSKEKEANMEIIHNALIKTQDIITELSASLDFEVGGEIAQNLFNLYRYFQENLVRANIDKNKEPIEEVYKHLEALRSAWSELQRSEKSSQNAPKSSVGINFAT